MFNGVEAVTYRACCLMTRNSAVSRFTGGNVTYIKNPRAPCKEVPLNIWMTVINLLEF